MPNTSDILWFKQQFGAKMQAGIAGTPFSVDMVTAIACQETGYIWQTLRKLPLTIDQILALCVGDTLDAPNRGAFPKTKAELIAKKDGSKMFDIARKGLEGMATYIADYKGVVKNANKFCHGFGVFQYDIQFFLTDPQYFLQKKYTDFNASLGKCVTELTHAQSRAGFGGRATLTDTEMAYVAIAYNSGSFKPARGLKQGYKDDSGKYYGELFYSFLLLCKTVALTGTGSDAGTGSGAGSGAGNAPVVIAGSSEQAIKPQSIATDVHPLTAVPTFISGKPVRYEVDVQHDPLRLRSEAVADPSKGNKNVVAWLPDGQIVQAISTKKVNGFLEVETSLQGAYYRGFAAADFLKPVHEETEIVVTVPATDPPSTGIKAVYMPRKEGTITRRKDPANAHSLNETGQPSRTGSSPDELKKGIQSIIKWLAVDNPSNMRYQPTAKSTFCNIYAHDFCFLSGVYLPRVWWSQNAIEQLAQGKDVQPQYGQTIDEQRANDLFRWLRAFGMRFGWHQASSLTELQVGANAGAIGLIVARRKDDGRSGHIVVVVPETNILAAKRDAGGNVVAPVQSQAGSTNFQYGNGRTNWWLGDEFAESAFWLHA